MSKKEIDRVQFQHLMQLMLKEPIYRINEEFEFEGSQLMK